MKSRYFNDCREMLDKNSILEPSDSGISIERFRALNWEKILWLRISSVHDVIVQSTVCLSLVLQLQKLNQSYLAQMCYVESAISLPVYSSDFYDEELSFHWRSRFLELHHLGELQSLALIWL